MVHPIDETNDPITINNQSAIYSNLAFTLEYMIVYLLYRYRLKCLRITVLYEAHPAQNRLYYPIYMF